MSLFNEIRNGKLTIAHPNNIQVLKTIPFSLDPDGKSGIAPLEFPSGLAVMKTTAGTIDQASSVHKDRLPYPINEISLDGIEPHHQITEELLFVKPTLPQPPSSYVLPTNHELDLMQEVWSDGTPKHINQPDASHIRGSLYESHKAKLASFENITDLPIKNQLIQQETERLLINDPELYSALYNRPITLNKEGEVSLEKRKEDPDDDVKREDTEVPNVLREFVGKELIRQTVITELKIDPSDMDTIITVGKREDDEMTIEELLDLKNTELKEIAKELNLRVQGNLRKSELIVKIARASGV